MIIDYDHNPAVSVDQKVQSLKESVQMALNEVDSNLALIKKQIEELKEEISNG